MIQAALAAGLTAEGVDVVDVGVIPTPGLAWLAADRGMPAAMVSASHNPFEDNGIKLLGPGGTKLAPEALRYPSKTSSTVSWAGPGPSVHQRRQVTAWDR